MITNFLANKFLNMLTARTYTMNSSYSYVGLSTTMPSKNGTGVNEVSGNGYARTMIGKSQSSGTVDPALLKMGAAADGETQNSEIIYFPEAIAPWGECLYLCIFDSATSGNLLAYSPILKPSYISEGITAIEVDYNKFADVATNNGGSYGFTYDGSTWKLNETAVNLSDYGIKITGTPTSGDTVEIAFGIEPAANQIPIIRAGQLKIALS